MCASVTLRRQRRPDGPGQSQRQATVTRRAELGGNNPRQGRTSCQPSTAEGQDTRHLPPGRLRRLRCRGTVAQQGNRPQASAQWCAQRAWALHCCAVAPTWNGGLNALACRSSQSEPWDKSTTNIGRHRPSLDRNRPPPIWPTSDEFCPMRIFRCCGRLGALADPRGSHGGEPRSSRRVPSVPTLGALYCDDPLGDGDPYQK